MRKTLIPIMIIIIAIIGYVAYLIYDLQSVTANGTIKAALIQNIMVDFPAYVNQVYVKDGQLVKAGDVLLTLNIKEYGAEIHRKEQDLCNAQSKLQEEQAGIYQLENHLLTAEATLKTVTQEWQDKQQLYQEGLVSRTDLENAEKEVITHRNIVANYRLS